MENVIFTDVIISTRYCGKMASVVDAILCYLDRNGTANSLNLASELHEDHQKIVGAIKSLQCLGTVIECEQVSGRRWELTEEGKQIAENGSHEALVYAAVPPPPNGISQTELMKAMPNSNVGFSKAMSSGWIAIDKTASGGPRITRKVGNIVDLVKESLIKIQNGQESDVQGDMKQDFKKRKLLKEVTVTSFDISQGPTFTTSITKQETDLTAEMIATNSWQNKTFKSYNYDAMGIPPTRGHLHPLLKVRAEFRQIFLEMGFSEMPTNNYVESSFWNFDTLFQPQQHPARDAHDTFFLSEPKSSNEFPKEYLKRVRDTHQYGGYGSQGYKYEWKLEEAQKNLLRTHTTAVSARLLYKLAQQEKFTPVKYFSIDRVFRNETLDATHLAEFNQIEGVIADYNLTLGDLMGVLQEFFKKLGIAKIRFKPAYNPYTEPSMEIFSFHEGLNKWVEVGNSGVFRPEMLLPMGLPKDVSVIAWGLSLERPTMIKYGISNIRDLVGHKVNLQMVYDNPICRLDKVSDALKVTSDWRDVEAHQVRVLDTLQRIQQELVKLKEDLGFKGTEQRMDNTDIIIHASAGRPPLSLIVLLGQLAHQNPVQFTSHIHSSVNNSTHSIVPKWEISQNNISSTSKNVPLKVTVIWKGSSYECKMFNSLNRKCIRGEANVARYLARILNPRYDRNAEIGTIIDQFIDLGNNLIESNQAVQQNAVMKVLNAHFANRVWLVQDQLTLADIFMFSAFQYVSCNVLHNVKRWHDACKDHPIFAILR